MGKAFLILVLMTSAIHSRVVDDYAFNQGTCFNLVSPLLAYTATLCSFKIDQRCLYFVNEKGLLIMVCGDFTLSERKSN